MLSLDLSGKRALIAGSTQGIGLAAAQALSSLGATCTLIARNESALEDAITTLDEDEEQGHRYLVADFSKPEEVKRVIEDAARDQGFHILINNTGGPPAGPIASATEEQFLAAFHQHLLCNHILATTLLPGMKAAKWGRIINVISTSVKVPLKGLGVSNTIRAAVAAWAKTLSVEVAPFGITVNNVLPGATATGRLDAILQNKAVKAAGGRDEAEAEMLAEIPAGRFGQPEEVAAAIAFLASASAGYINGINLPVDGGRTGAL